MGKEIKIPFVKVVPIMFVVFMEIFFCTLASAADFEVILGTSSAFNVVRGTNIANGTSTFYIGSSTVSVGTTTQGGMLRVAGTSTASTADFEVLTSGGTHSFFISSNNGYIGIGTNTPSKSLHVAGTITVGSGNKFMVDENGSVTAASFTGDGSRLTNIATAVNGASITPSTISTGSATVSTLTATGSATVTGTLTAANGAFAVNESGATTVSTLTSGSSTISTLTATGSATVNGALTAASGNFTVNESGATTVSTLTAGSSTVSDLKINGSLTAGGGTFVVDTAGSTTVKLLTVNGSITAANGNFFVDATLGSVTAAGTVTAGSFSTAGTITTSNIYSAGTITLTTNANGGIQLPGYHSGTNGTMTITGNLMVIGGFDATGKAFLIPHPDPSKEGWVLRHSCIEGPTRGDTQYRYTVEVKTNGGEASITLPPYWRYLNENPQV